MSQTDRALTETDARLLVRQFEQVRARARGLPAAPISWLPSSPDDLIAALETAMGPAPDRATVIRTKEAIVDLQAFGPEPAAAAAQRVRARTPLDDEDRRLGEEALESILRAQAEAICYLRGEDRVVGAMNALRPLDGVLIGDAERALAAVDRYKEGQASGFASMVGGPIVVGVGAVVGGIVLGFDSVGLGLAILVAIAYFFIGAVVGQVVGGVASRARRRARVIDDERTAVLATSAVEVGQVVALIGIPAALGLAAMAIGPSVVGA
jgi:hypothetical protein